MILIAELFIMPADGDYITARWAYENALFRNFYWMAAQAVEKYLKAMLLSIGETTKPYKHDIGCAYDVLKERDNRKVLRTSINLPDTTAMGRKHFDKKPIREFIDYISRLGSPNSRYGLSDINIGGPAIHALDQLCFDCRHYINTYNSHNVSLSKLFDVTVLPPMIPHKKEVWMLGTSLQLERLFLERYRVGETIGLRKAFSNMNFSFFNERDEGERTFGGMSLKGAPLENHLVRFRSIDKSSSNQEIISQLKQWCLENISLSKDLKKKL